MPAAKSYEEAMVAVKAWYKRYGRLPAYSDWEYAGPGRPCSRTIQRRWGWNQFLATALDIPLGKVREYQGLVWTEAELVDILLEGRRRLGRWPTQAEWLGHTEDQPSSRTFCRFFGSWSGALAAADRALDRAPAGSIRAGRG